MIILIDNNYNNNQKCLILINSNNQQYNKTLINMKTKWYKILIIKKPIIKKIIIICKILSYLSNFNFRSKKKKLLINF